MVKYMKISELQRKDVININDGKIVGRIIDAVINENDGSLEALVLDKSKYIKSLFSADGEVKINFSQIRKIGTDVILIDI